MKKIKINRYFSKKYDDIDVYGMKFLSDNLSDAWEKVFDIFPDSKIIALIEAEFDSQQLSALIDENMRTYIDILSVSETTSIVICDKTIFLKLLTKLNISVNIQLLTNHIRIVGYETGDAVYYAQHIDQRIPHIFI